MPCKEVPTTVAARGEAPGFEIDPDLEPLFVLQPKDYERIINRMANLIIGVMLYLQEVRREDAAKSLGRSAARLLADYDDDVAELVQFATSPRNTSWSPDSNSRFDV